ncbi:FAD-binding monooxygenase [Pseudooceanicola sp. MF1-13]|uniref:FAD-binding monooxygenase n=1 Tax=Pseudooceanicola sp. MF1-13 TaxID=3379095 RepID=UPI0038917F41
MQYHLNGFRAGDPTLFAAAPGRSDDAPMPDVLDVLIVGCGPAGLTLAAQLAGFPEITTRIVERKDGPIERGQADGVSCRSMEMFQAFGFAETVKEQGYWVNETTFWKTDEDEGKIARIGRVQDVEDGLSEMPHMILNQARVHDMYLDVMRKSPSRLVPDYGVELVDLVVDPEGGDHPVAVTLRHKDGEEQTVRTRYVVGCDGARSGVRKAIGRELVGDSANKAWGVMDVLCVTDFPDARCKTLIQSAEKGNVLIIPREGGYLVRLYIEMDKLGEGERVASRNLQVDDLIGAAQSIFAPYTLDVKHVVWWSVYEIGQRLTDKFDDVPEGSDRLPHVFIAGDACHTHSPKAGQGMNVSMGDTFNLGWKLISVLTGRAAPELLHSYSAERQKVAQDLIDFDREWSQIMSARPDGAAGDTPTFQKYFVEHGRYTAGFSVTYEPSTLTGEGAHQALATGFPVGERFHSAPVVRLADAKPMQLGHVARADARWRVYCFAGADDTGASGGAIAKLCDALAASGSWWRDLLREGEDLDALIDLRAVFQQGFRDLAFEDMPALLRPSKGQFGLTDYEKVFCADPRAGDIFDMRGIDRAEGAIVIVRPDQYVADILPLDDGAGLQQFFAGVFT